MMCLLRPSMVSATKSLKAACSQGANPDEVSFYLPFYFVKLIACLLK